MDFSLFNMLSIGILVIDTQLKVIYINDAYANFLHKTPEELVGLHIKKVLPHTKLDEVVQSGIAQRSMWQQTEQGFLFGHRIPLYQDGEVVGAFAELLLHNTDELEKLTSELAAQEAQIKYLNTKLNSGDIEQRGALVTQSEAMKDVLQTVMKVAPLDTTVLVSGETGSGKELIADMVYQYSGRGDRLMVKINCAAIPMDLIESELFGYEKGAFTGANNAGKSGKFEIADRGVLFLDEISSMPLAMQSKLLRVIQEKEVERLGGTKRKKIDVKIVAATNINIEELVKQNRFREDLFYRLNVINIRVPPLRERPEDILLLASHFLQIYQSRFYKPLTKLSYGASKLLESYRWPGNVRELKNVMERLAIMCDGRHITQLDITNYTSIQQHEKVPNTLKEQIDYYEKTIIIDSLKRHNGNKSLVALELGLNRTTLYSKLHKYSILCQESAKPE